MLLLEKTITVNYLFNACKNHLNSDWTPTYREARAGDIRNSLADVSLAEKLIGYKPMVNFEEGLKTTIEFFKKLYS